MHTYLFFKFLNITLATSCSSSVSPPFVDGGYQRYSFFLSLYPIVQLIVVVYVLVLLLLFAADQM